MSQIIEAFERYFQCVKLNMPRMEQNCTPPQKIGLSRKRIANSRVSAILGRTVIEFEKIVKTSCCFLIEQTIETNK